LLAFAGASFSFAIALAGAVRKRHSVASWCFSAGMAAMALEAVCDGISFNALRVEDIAIWQNLALITRSILPGLWLCFSLTYSRGNYREFLSRWRLPLAAAFLLPIAISATFRTDLVEVLAYPSPKQGWWLALGDAGKALNGFFLIAAVLILMNLERTFRSAIGTMRWRIKFLVLGLGIIFGARFYTRSQALLFSGHDLALTNIETGALVIGCVLMSTAYFRSGFAEIDVYPSRAVLHTSVVVLLAGSYLFVVGVLAQVVAHFGGARSFPLEAFLVLVAAAILAVLLLSERIRQRIQLFVSRHFRRPQHDFREIWTRLTQSMSAVLDEAALCTAASRLISERFNALSVSIWLFDQPQERLVRTSSTLHSHSDPMPGGGDPSRELLAREFGSVALNKLSRPFDLEKARDQWTKPLKEITPGRFKTGGNRICIPLIAGDSRLGVIVLADRVGGLRYTAEEIDLLKCIGDQVAASLLNVELTKEQVAGKELEAFQTMSAFFIHDLKNATSTLSLMLQNLPAHFDDPSFREDALRGIGSTVDRINHLISRLGTLRHELKLTLREVDLNLLLAESFRNLDSTLQGKLTTKLGPVPKIVADQEQLESVIVNLLLNAYDAIDNNGQITVETRQEDGWVSVSILDNGCGMSPTFVKDSLFRPFQTTKKKGLGIGMFQSKMIVEAHRGKIQVKSELGTGTTFRIMLPLAPRA
jgi:putative PEP-CTERM system histidine kinase